jgi:hypothetical protein
VRLDSVQVLRSLVIIIVPALIFFNLRNIFLGNFSCFNVQLSVSGEATLNKISTPYVLVIHFEIFEDHFFEYVLIFSTFMNMHFDYAS